MRGSCSACHFTSCCWGRHSAVVRLGPDHELSDVGHAPRSRSLFPRMGRRSELTRVHSHLVGLSREAHICSKQNNDLELCPVRTTGCHEYSRLAGNEEPRAFIRSYRMKSGFRNSETTNGTSQGADFMFCFFFLESFK